MAEQGARVPKRRKAKKYPGYLKKRGDAFLLSLCVGGKRYNFTVITDDPKEAARYAIQKDAELRRAHDRVRMGLPGSIVVSELLDMFEEQELPKLSTGTRAAYNDSLKVIRTYFVEQLLDPALERIHAKHVSGFLSWRRVNSLEKGAATVSNRTLQKDRAVLHRVFAIAEQLEYREGNPVARVDPPKADARNPVILTAEEYERLIQACAGKPMVELYVLLLGEAGLRCESEALWLQWSDVDLEGGFLTITSGRDGHRTKGGRTRHVPMTPRLRTALRSHFAEMRFAAYDGQRPPWVFHHRVTHGTRMSGKRVGSLRDAFRNAAVRAKLPAGLHQHDLRHRRVTTWLAEGADVTLVKEAMGHSDLRTTMGYTHLSKEHLRKLIVDPGVKTEKKTG